MELLKYVSDADTLVGAERLIAADGKAKGMTLVRMYNGVLQLFLKEDKCLDIWRCDWRGQTVSYLCKNGMVSPRLTHTGAFPFVSGFDGGLLYTCGLDSVGAPKDGSVQHGAISSVPAEHVNIERGEDAEGLFVRVSGEMRQTALFGTKLVLRRSVTLHYLSERIDVEDELTNAAHTPAGFELIYHFNLGYPLVDDHTRVCLPVSATVPLSREAADALAEVNSFRAPTPGQPEQVYCHRSNPGRVRALIDGKAISLAIDYDGDALPYLIQWKSMACGDYVLGVEPSATDLSDRKKTALAPGESRRFGLAVTITENRA